MTGLNGTGLGREVLVTRGSGTHFVEQELTNE